MIRLDDELGGNGRLPGPGAHQALIGAPPEREAKRIQENRFPRPGLARKHAQPWPEGEAEPVYEDDIANGEAEEH